MTDDLPRLAAVFDSAAQQSSRYRVWASGREQLGLPLLGDVPEDLPLGERAVLWALEYHVETTDGQGRRRVRLAPRHESGADSDPPAVRDVPDEIAQVWRELLPLVTAPVARARLQHLLFERGDPQTRQHATDAAAAYVESAAAWERGLDSVHDLAAAARLARAVGDSGLAARAADAMTAVAADELAADDPKAGVVLRALAHLVGEPDCPGAVDALLETAAARWDATRSDKALDLMLRRCRGDAEQTATVWRRRVALFTAEADGAASAVMRAVRLRQALALAERSGDSALRQQAAAALQSVRADDLEMMSFTATSRRYEEELEAQVAAVSDGDTWQAALVRFARFGPVTGGADANRAVVRAQHAEHPLAALFPTQLLGPDGLPVYTGTTEEDRFDVDLARWETQLVEQWLPVLSAGLHAVAERHGIPTLRDVEAFLSQWPAAEPAVAAALARALLRFWCGDSEAAAYTALPRIESVVRALVLRSDRGVYRLQREHVPGQYAGLGALLPILVEEYRLDESEARFYSAVLRHPAALNLRNHMSHGFVGDPGPGYAALVLHTALRVAAIEPPAAATG